jgi:hypothetical protein
LRLSLRAGEGHRIDEPPWQLLGLCLQRNAARLAESGALHGQRFLTRRHARDETLAWLLWYNASRLHSTFLNYVSPMQSEEHGQAQQAKQA